MYSFQSEKKSYKMSFIFAIILHVTIVGFFFIKFTTHIQESSAPQVVDIVKAEAVSQKDINSLFAKLNLEKEQAELAEKQKVAAQQKILEEQQKQIEAQKEAAIQRQLQQKSLAEQKEKQRVLEIQQKQKADALVAQKALQQKLAEEKAAKEIAEAAQQKILREQQQELAAVTNKIAQQKKALAMQAEKNNKQALDKIIDRQLNEESKLLSSSKGASKAVNTSVATPNKQDQAAIDKYKSMIIKAISDEWIVPKSIAPGVTCKLLVTVAPDGAVLKVDIIQKSGNDLLDSSAKTAVLKASPLPVPKDLDLFDNFRTLRLTVKPEGIVNDE